MIFHDLPWPPFKGLTGQDSTQGDVYGSEYHEILGNSSKCRGDKRVVAKISTDIIDTWWLMSYHQIQGRSIKAFSIEYMGDDSWWVMIDGL